MMYVYHSLHIIVFAQTPSWCFAKVAAACGRMSTEQIEEMLQVGVGSSNVRFIMEISIHHDLALLRPYFPGGE